MAQVGRVVLLAGVVLVGLGALLMVGDRLGLGRLPGDLVWRRKNLTVHLPLATSLVLSLVLTLLLNLWLRRR